MNTVIRGIVFDKDGTLFDFNATWGAWTAGFLEQEAAGDAILMARLAAVLGYDLDARVFRPDSIVIAHTGQEIAAAVHPLLPPQSKESLIERMNDRAARAPQVEATPLVGFVQDLKARALSIGVVTNDAEAPARSHLRAAGVEQGFDFIAGFDSGFGAKPKPDPLLAFSAAVGIAPQHCAMVGDSTHDLHAGRAAGMTTVAVLTGVADADALSPFADVVLPSIAALPAWLDGKTAQ